MHRFAIYLVGLLVVLAAVWLLLTQTGLAAFLPVTIILVAMLLVLGFGVMRAAHTVEERPLAGHEVVETRERLGPGSEVRRRRIL